MSNQDPIWMRRALRLAACARHASPNPMVGCVLVGPDGRKLGEGWTQPPGGPHAEIMALRDWGGNTLPPNATAYVTLEPCSHHGRTPPCAEALLAAKVGRVVAAMTDPDTRVAGQGFARLREAGVSVDVGLCEAQAHALNAAFIKHRTTGLPWVVLKTAMTLDGKIATRTGHSQWITSPVARLAVHRTLRDRCDAILTGVGTVLADDPSLTTRLPSGRGRNPLRVVVDSRARTPLTSQVVRLAAQDGRTLIAVTPNADNNHRMALEDAGCRTIVCDADAHGRVSLPALMGYMGTREGLIGVLVEGGSEIAASVLEAGLADRWVAFIAPKVIGGASAPGPVGGAGAATMGDALFVTDWRVGRCGPDLRIDTRIGIDARFG